MSVPSQTIVAASCKVRYVNGAPEFVGIGNQGFLPFGPNDSSHSYRSGVGVYTMRLVLPIDLAGGAGAILPAVESLGATTHIESAPIPGSSNAIGVILTFNGGTPLDVPFWLTVLRYPQTLEG